MIKLDVRAYCYGCTEFFGQEVTQRPEQLNADFGDFDLYGDTVVECVHQRHCEALYNHLKKENDNAEN